MKKIIIIGECGLDVVYDGPQPVGSMPAGRLLNAAMMLARKGLPVSMVGDTGADPLGDIIVGSLVDAGVDTASVDRYVDGQTPVTFFFGDKVTSYRLPSREGGFDVVWPRIDPGDIVVFGGYYAIDPLIHQRLMSLVSHAVERKAFIVYLPGFMLQLAPRLTRVMPTILENLEVASLVVSRSADLVAIYNDADVSRCYSEHVAYYSSAMVNLDAAGGTVSCFCGKSSLSSALVGATDTLLWNSAAVAAVISALYRDESLSVANPSLEMLSSAISQINAFTGRVLSSYKSQWQLSH